jgi:hypothetical protein
MAFSAACWAWKHKSSRVNAFAFSTSDRQIASRPADAFLRRFQGTRSGIVDLATLTQGRGPIGQPVSLLVLSYLLGRRHHDVYRLAHAVQVPVDFFG